LIDIIYEKTLKHINKLGGFCLEVSSIEMNIAFIFTQLLSKQTIKIIDIGGACGANYFFARKLLPQDVGLSWLVMETPAMVKKASALATDELIFSLSDAEKIGSLAGKEVDALLFSGVLQYLPEPYEYLRKTITIEAKYIIICRTCFFEDSDALYIRKSHLFENGPGSAPNDFADREVQYPERILNLNEIRNILSADYDCLAAWNKEPLRYVFGKEVVAFSALYKKRETSLTDSEAAK
jgi:putative methyltransferase (TIGR04325 family)